jgi:hypothetical protein
MRLCYLKRDYGAVSFIWLESVIFIFSHTWESFLMVKKSASRFWHFFGIPKYEKRSIYEKVLWLWKNLSQDSDRFTRFQPILVRKLVFGMLFVCLCESVCMCVSLVPEWIDVIYSYSVLRVYPSQVRVWWI